MKKRRKRLFDEGEERERMIGYAGVATGWAIFCEAREHPVAGPQQWKERDSRGVRIHWSEQEKQHECLRQPRNRRRRRGRRRRQRRRGGLKERD